MEKISLKKEFGKDHNELSKCPVCEVYVHQDEGFVCSRCRKGPLCRKHRVAGRKECASCVFDLKKRDLNVLRDQERSIRNFLKFLQFVFLVFAIFFIAFKFGLAEFVEVLKDVPVSKYMVYMGIIPVTGYILFMMILYNQRSKIEDIEHQIKKLEVRK
jgi:hypothetical protein